MQKMPDYYPILMLPLGFSIFRPKQLVEKKTFCSFNVLKVGYRILFLGYYPQNNRV